jgi:RNA recognition motif-containing protein
MNLFIGNLNPETTASKLRPLFAEFGEVLSAKVIIDNATGMSRGFGFVEYADKNQALDAIDNIDATFFDGNIISVKEAKQSNTNKGHGPSGGRSGGGYGNRNTSGGSSYGTRPGGGSGYSGNKPLRPRTPRPGGFNNNNSINNNNAY